MNFLNWDLLNVDGEEVLDGHDLVINNSEARIDDYRDFMDKMADILGDRFDKQRLPKEERVSSKSASNDWHQNVLDKFV